MTTQHTCTHTHPGTVTHGTGYTPEQASRLRHVRYLRTVMTRRDLTPTQRATVVGWYGEAMRAALGAHA